MPPEHARPPLRCLPIAVVVLCQCWRDDDEFEHPVTVAATSRSPPLSPAEQARQGDTAWLAGALTASRADTLALSAALEAALGPKLTVPQRPSLNPPLWELGHIGWFQEFWLARNTQRAVGVAADPDAPRLPPICPDADALYDSSRVPHASRWSLPLPGLEATRAHLAQQLEGTLKLLQLLPSHDDELLYFFRLTLLHEDMHHEAALYMARALDVAVPDDRWRPQAQSTPRAELAIEPDTHRLGHCGPGFAFDNELQAQPVQLSAYGIDSRAVTWREFLPFAEAGGYQQARWWSDDGQRWLERQAERMPRYLRRDGGTWCEREQGSWQALDLDLTAVHLSWFEADAWCRWAGRRLPTEAQWERAATLGPESFTWGQVWEWTSSPFAAFEGFVAHPYRDYSAPFFDGRPVLRGASHLTQPRMRHPRYRNYFTPDRNDVPAGFRTCRAD
jgi:gamma-glutamyl hercynylcysteine S-oxide synthase